MRGKGIIFFLLFYFAGTSAQTLRVGLFHENILNTIVVTFEKGGGHFISGAVKLKLKQKEIVYLSKSNKKIQVRCAGRDFIVSDSLIVEANDSSVLKVKSVSPSLPERFYQGKITILNSKYGLEMLNTVSLDTYIAGVVEAEGGPGAPFEFYKAQAVLCRTYVIKHWDKHSAERFNMCDEVHCQAFKGIVRLNRNILKATYETSGLVVCDSINQLITAAFHSNSGGYTTSASEVWLRSEPNMVATEDPYSRNGKNFSWQKEISRAEWINYLKIIGKDNGKFLKEEVLSQYKRKNYFVDKGDSVPVQAIRNYFNLKSAFFSVKFKDQKVIFIGKGYGHGIGMSQEGAMQMALQGKKMEDILKFYYSGIKIISITSKK